MLVAEGQLLAGKFRIDRVLGQGGMGVVVAAHHIALDEEVAIKFLLPEALQNPEAIGRFEREARAAVKIRSEHVARVSDVGRLENGAPYIVMESLRGRDLAALLREQGPLSVQDMADYVLQAGEAIAEAHALGIVHRDLKPQNLFLTQRADGSVCIKVLDFGISKMTGVGALGDGGMTGTSAVMGSPLYMSPEQLVSARDVDLRTDIWALGVICYQLLCGRTPFMAETLPQLCIAIATQSPTPLLSVRPDVPLALDALIGRCLERDRTRRISSVAELARELVKFGSRHAALSAERIDRLARGGAKPQVALAADSASAALSATTAAPAVVPEPTLGAFGRTEQSGSQKRHPAVYVAAAAAVGLLAAVAWTVVSKTHSTPATATELAASNSVTAAAPAASPAPSLPTASTAIEVPEPSAEPESVPSSAPAAPSVRAATPRLTNKSAQTARSARPQAQQPDCDPAYYYDSRGNKVFKKGCL